MPNEMSPQECAERLEEINTSNCLTCEHENLNPCKFCDKTHAIKYAATVMHKLAVGEIKPVIHAHWISHGCEMPWCSNCQEEALIENETDDIIYSDYCPSCGAVMDGDDNNATH